jgi:site-specific DNA-cytosine methylase
LIAEIDPPTSSFCDDHFDVEIIVETVKECAAPKVRDVRTKVMKNMPPHQGVYFGFSCQSISNANNASSENVGCVQDGLGKTGCAFKDTQDVIAAHRPERCFGENLKNLEIATPQHQCSNDAIYVKEWFRKMGYWSESYICKAADSGSGADRCRWLLFCVRGDVKSIARLLYIEQVLGRIRVPPIDDDAFEVGGDEIAQRRPIQQVTKKIKADATYLEVHAQAFGEKGIAWPPSLNDFKEALGTSLNDLGGRSLEVVYYIHKAHPPKVTEDKKTMVQWIDVNQSLERLCGPKFEKNPWSDRIMTVTTKMLLVKRGTIKTGDGVSFSQFKLMDGVELMQLMGFDISYFKTDKPLPSNALATQMAGNAFSGFMLGAFHIATTCGSQIQTLKGKIVEIKDEEGGGGSSGSDDSGEDDTSDDEYDAEGFKT